MNIKITFTFNLTACFTATIKALEGDALLTCKASFFIELVSLIHNQFFMTPPYHILFRGNLLTSFKTIDLPFEFWIK